jgi:hypothetical protein
MIVQEYFAEHYERYGFDAIEGPFKTGPDFKVRKQGNEQFELLEVEILWDNYLKHRHDKSARFSETKYLVMLLPESPREDFSSRLPEKYIKLDFEHFVKWFKNYDAHKRFSVLTPLLEGHFAKLYQLFCDRTKSDMALCGTGVGCSHCPYCPQPYPFELMAIKFLLLTPVDFESADFRLANFSPTVLYNFYQLESYDPGYTIKDIFCIENK